MSALVDALMAPLAGAPPAAGVLVFALATTIPLLLVFRLTLNPDRVDRAKRQMQAAIFEMRLFQDDPRAVLRAAVSVLRHNGAYLRAWLVPMVLVAVPFVALVAQGEAFFGYRGLPLHTPAVLFADVPAGDGSSLRLEAPPGVRVESEAIWFPAARQAAWRVVPEAEGQHALTVRRETETFEKTMQVSERVVRRSPVRAGGGVTNRLLYPSEPALPAGAAVTALTLEYPAAAVNVAGWRVHWLALYLLGVLVFAYALRRPFGVVF